MRSILQKRLKQNLNRIQKVKIYVLYLEQQKESFKTPVKDKNKEETIDITSEIQNNETLNKPKEMPLKLTDYNDPDLTQSKSDIK